MNLLIQCIEFRLRRIAIPHICSAAKKVRS